MVFAWSRQVKRAEHPALGNDAGSIAGLSVLGIKITDNAREVFEEAESVIEFSGPEATVGHASLGRRRWGFAM